MESQTVNPSEVVESEVETVKAPSKGSKEAVFLKNLPDSNYYEKSFMHRAVINFVTFTNSDFLITASIDGHVKFWKKSEDDIVFVKHFRVHMGSILAVAASVDGFLYCTISDDKTCKVFDIINFDMINMLLFNFKPLSVCWIYKEGHQRSLLAISDSADGKVYIYDGKGDKTVLNEITTHNSPVSVISYNSTYDVFITSDNSGIIEFWDSVSMKYPEETLDFQYKTDTDLYQFVKDKTHITSLCFSPNGQLFVCSCSNRKFYVFKFCTGKLLSVFDESVSSSVNQQEQYIKINNVEFGRKIAIEKDIEKNNCYKGVNVAFDESSNFIIYTTLFGIKMINIRTNQFCRLIGKFEGVRFMNFSLYQGIPNRKRKITNLETEGSTNPILQRIQSDPTIVCTAYNENRFYLFTKRNPYKKPEDKDVERDIYNEKPTTNENDSTAGKLAISNMPDNATIHTSMGDICIKLYKNECPKTVENFITHSRNGYYDGLTFHRVIAGFIIQTGDPKGNGTGGDSIWGKDFEDEFHPSLRHNEPFVVSMANAGPNTNGSQFFVTVAPAPWLDDKHTLFAKVTQGASVARAISIVKVNEMTERPIKDVTILSVSFK